MIPSDAVKQLTDEIEKRIANGEDPDKVMDELVPRVAYFGHKVIHTFRHPDRRARWECVHCQYQWVGEEGHQCPACKRCSNNHQWEWVAEPYGPQDRACKFCGITLREDMGDEKFAAYIKREQQGRKRLNDVE